MFQISLVLIPSRNDHVASYMNNGTGVYEGINQRYGQVSQIKPNPLKRIALEDPNGVVKKKIPNSPRNDWT